MMKQRKWLIKSIILLAWIGAGAGMLSLYPLRAHNPVEVESGDSTALKPVPLPDITLIPYTDSLCHVTDPSNSLSSFFAELDGLQAGKDTVISVVHLGDSHIQAGYYSGMVMRHLQQDFGNAGRGWIAPLKLSRTNEPDDYFITSTVREWISGRCIQNKRKCPIGLGGIGIQSVSTSINLDISIAPVNGAGYAFNQAILYRGDQSMPMLPTGALKDSVRTSLASAPAAPGILADTFRLPFQTDVLNLHSTRRKQGTDELLPASSFKNVYFGFSQTNGRPGLLYNSIGVNGAMYVNYTEETYVRQLALLHPSLLIVSMGTNETFGRRFNTAEFTAQVKAFISLVKKYMPGTTLLLTTPPECYKRAYVNKKRTFVRNDNTQRAAKVIVSVAKESGIACWDLFAATGGKNSSVKWYKAKLMGRDRVHFTKEGYREQGALLYRALMKTYNQSIENHYVQ